MCPLDGSMQDMKAMLLKTLSAFDTALTFESLRSVLSLRDLVHTQKEYSMR